MDATKIRELREEMGLSQKALAARSGVSQGYLSQLETGEVLHPSLRVAEQLAVGLGIPFCALLERLGVACGCGTDWGDLTRHPIMDLFGRLSPARARLAVDLMQELADG